MTFKVRDIIRSRGITTSDDAFDYCFSLARDHLTPHIIKKSRKVVYVNCDGKDLTAAMCVYDDVGDAIFDMCPADAGRYFAAFIDNAVRKRGKGIPNPNIGGVHVHTD